MIAIRVSLLLVCSVKATEMSTTSHANPIRKVVTMLQSMSKKVEAEGEKETAAFEKFMCYCKTGGGDLDKSIADAKTKIPDLEAGIEGGAAKKTQLEKDLEGHKADKASANTAIAEATALREKESSSFAKETSEDKAEVSSISSALAALEGGLSGAFLQTPAAAHLRKTVTAQDMEDSDRQAVMSFLSGTQSSPGTDSIVGILKTMKEEMAQGLTEAEATETDAKATFAELLRAKKKEVKAATKMTEEKLQRVGQLATEIETMKNELTDTKDCLVEDVKMLATLKKSCATKEEENAKSQKLRQEELLALADTIKILNDDDTLELFKKTLPGASSFMQIQVSASAVRARALRLLHSARRHPHSTVQVDFIALALRGKKVGFEGVIKMIGELRSTLKAEQAADDKKKAYCTDEFDKSADKQKALERRISDTTSAIGKAKEDIVALAEALEKLAAGVKALDASVAEATAQRKEEHSDYSSLMANNGAAKEVLKFAKNRLNKFYNPAQYKPPASASLAQVHEHESKSSGVIQMINILIGDLDKEMTEAEVTEKNSQEDYEQAMKDAQAKRATDSKALAESESEKADLEASLEELAATKKAAKKELMATEKYISALHSDCDFLLKYFDVRKEARDSEIDAMTKAESVLSGADYSFLQVASTKAHGFLGHA